MTINRTTQPEGERMAQFTPLERELYEALEALGEALGTVTVPRGHPLLAASAKATAALTKARGKQ